MREGIRGFTPGVLAVIMKASDNGSGRLGKAGDCMTGKEVVNLIRKLKEKGMSSDEILAIIEYIETHDPREQE
nr:hypothetical protein [uncultured Acetatifactor sp.]